ncbi:MAG: S41 family peptidase [Chloroflexi bacterium]|nr:MAG: S41 family peptidase [Chloroflexota bacterium]
MKLRAVLMGGAYLVAGAFVFAAGGAAGIYADQAYPDVVPYLAHHQVGRVDTTELAQAIRLIQADYVDGNVDMTKLSHGTVSGLVASLGDPYSTYYDPDQYKRLQDAYEGRYSGIGIYLAFGTGYPTITGTVPGSPAARAGLQGGDQIVKVGGKDTKGATADQATALIQGANGTSVTLTIQRGTSTFDVTLVRTEIQIPSVRSTQLPGHILYVRIYSFGSSTSADFAAALNDGLKGAKGVVLDLRENPGGFISAADDVISDFVTSGETFELRGRNGSVERHTVSGSHPAPAVRLVVLVDANSASAAEIVAGSLQVHKRAKLIGTVSFGKGSVQQDFPLPDGADIHLTIKRWYLPDGTTIDHKGLQPDVTVTLASSADEFDVLQPGLGYAKDKQLNAALALLSSG